MTLKSLTYNHRGIPREFPEKYSTSTLQGTWKDVNVWNKSNESDIHIAPKPSKSVALKDECFNCLTLTCAISLYHIDDVLPFFRSMSMLLIS